MAEEALARPHHSQGMTHCLPRKRLRLIPDLLADLGDAILQKISKLSPTEFENLTFDCVKAAGLRNVTWRTPGADGGRDIEGEEYTRDFSGHDTVHKWYVECKLYSSSIDWPTVWKKISYADVQGADYLLLVTNNNPSPACETKINEWNESGRYPRIRTWRGYDLPSMLRSFPQVAVTHGLSESAAEAQSSLLPLVLLATNLGQSAYSAAVFGTDGVGSALEAVSALNELISRRLADLRSYQRPAFAADQDTLADYEWLQIIGVTEAWEGAGLRAVLAVLRHVASSELVSATFDGRGAKIVLANPDNQLGERALFDLDTVARWAGVQVTLESGSIRITRTWGAGQ